MQILTFKREPSAERMADLQLMQTYLNDEHFDAGLADIEAAWTAHSATYEAGWLLIPADPDEVVQALLNHLD